VDSFIGPDLLATLALQVVAGDKFEETPFMAALLIVH
jgi:hypothetical protein